MIWPPPTPQELHAAYSIYYTQNQPIQPQSAVAKLWQDARHAYLARNYSYPVSKHTSRLATVLSFAISLLPNRRKDIEAGVFYLPAPKVNPDTNETENRLLEVGCGSGKLLYRMKNLGWMVTGIDLDSDAFAEAKSLGVDVRKGELQDHDFNAGEFHIVVMNHVIEHLSDPLKVLEHCRHLLKPGGKLILLTPNCDSRGHQKWGEYWRGLEVPRHLQIFNIESLSMLVKRAGFTIDQCKTTGKTRFAEKESRRMYRKMKGMRPMPNAINSLLSELTEIREVSQVKKHDDLGHELHLIASVPPEHQTNDNA